MKEGWEMPGCFPSPHQAVDVAPGSDALRSSVSIEFTFSILVMASKTEWKCTLIY